MPYLRNSSTFILQFVFGAFTISLNALKFLFIFNNFLIFLNTLPKARQHLSLLLHFVHFNPLRSARSARCSFLCANDSHIDAAFVFITSARTTLSLSRWLSALLSSLSLTHSLVHSPAIARVCCLLSQITCTVLCRLRRLRRGIVFWETRFANLLSRLKLQFVARALCVGCFG